MGYEIIVVGMCARWYIMNMLDSVERYLAKELGIFLATEPAMVNLPRYLQSYYQWCQANMGERSVLLVEPQAPALALQPGEKIGHLQWMEKEVSLPVLWCADKMTAYERRSFNQQRIAYVIPGKQLNAPLLGLLASRAVHSPILTYSQILFLRKNCFKKKHVGLANG